MRVEVTEASLGLGFAKVSKVNVQLVQAFLDVPTQSFGEGEGQKAAATVSLGGLRRVKGDN